MASDASSFRRNLIAKFWSSVSKLPCYRSLLTSITTTTVKNIAYSVQNVFHSVIDKASSPSHHSESITGRTGWLMRLLLCSQQDLDYWLTTATMKKNVCSIQRKHLKYPAKCSYFIYKRTVIPFWRHTKVPEGITLGILSFSYILHCIG